ncbi:unnamed protein product [Sphagnum troendelagicum]|uniref:Putative zinc-finger domain-containing protein n=1 Tax=Sphagnum troendelagicum TaxID=128251 RepID=A0ABP0UVE8_9BRYO
MGNERQIEMLRAKVVASMPLRKSQQSTNSVAVEEREEGELSAEDEESLVPAMVSSSPPPLLPASRNRVPKLETRTQSSIEEKPIFPTSFKAQTAQPTTQVSIVNKSQLLNMFSAPAPPLASLQGPMPDIGLARHQGTPMQIDANSVGGQMNSSMNKLREVAPAASMQPVMPSFGHPITHGRKRGRSREAITVPFMHSKVIPPVAPRVGAIAMSSGLHSPQPASAPVSGVHSEVEAFLASLHLPVVPTSSTPFSEENFVIKFDSDSDSEGEQQLIRSNQGQFISATSGQQSTSLSSQSPADMRSEIDRMKKQIAVMERSKAKTNSNSNLTSQSVTLSKNVGPRIGTVNLENLRQQIAAKENELLERRQRLAVTSPMEKPHLPVGKVLEQRNSVTKKSQTLSTRTNLSNPSGKSASVPAEDMTFLVGSQGSQDTSIVISSTGQAVWASVEQGPITAFVVSRPDSGLSSKDGVLPKDAQGGGLSPGPQVFVNTISVESPVSQECGNEHALGLEAEIPSSTSQQINVFEPDAPPQATVSSVSTMVELSTASSAGTPIHVAESTPSRSIPSTVMLSTPTSSLPAAREEVRRVVPSFTIKSPIYSPITTATGYDAAIPSLHLPGYALWPPLHQLQAATNQLEPSGIHGPIWSIDSAREGGMQLLQRLQEDEDAVDKALEEAQVRRRKCEVSEREARRLYQDAKTALASANALCDALLHQRKLLSAQLHAAEFRMLQLTPFAVPTDRQLTSDHHAQLTELPLEFSSAAWTNQQQSPPRVHVKGNPRQGTYLEGLCEDSGANGLECQRSSEEKNLQHLTQNVVGVSAPIENLPGDRSQKPITQLGDTEKKDSDEINTPLNEQVQSADREQPLAGWAQELPVPLILKDTTMIATQDSQSDSEEDGHDYDISNEAIPILLKCKPEITGLRALADNDANNGLISEQDVHVQGESLVDSTNTGLLESSDSLTCATKDATVQQLEYELAPDSLKAFQFQTDKEKMDLLSQKFGHSQKEAQGFGREQQSGGVEHSQVQKGSIIEPVNEIRALSPCQTHCLVAAREPESKTWSHDIDIWKLLCKFEHRGKCNNDACLGQHVADYTLDHTGLLSQLQRYVNPEKQLGDDGMSPRAIEAAIAAIVDEAQTSANLTQNKVASGKLFLEDKLQWNKELSVPIYQIGPYIVLPDQTNLCSRVRCLLGFRSKVVSFSSSLLSPALCRLLPPDVPCLLAAAVEDSSITSPAEESSWRYIEDAGDSQEVAEEHVLKHPGDIEAWLELALTIIDYDLTCQDVDAQRKALYILSRALEANPSVVMLWVVYIGLFYNRESSIGIDDMFHHAVGFNPASYELWLLLINSRLKLGDCLDAYKLALQGLCSLEEEDREEQSACILDLTLQMLNCMCIASQTLLLNGWVDELVNHEGSNRRLLAFLIPNDSCILWVGCAYAVAFGELPREFVQRFGCNQELPFYLNWDRRSEVQHGTGGPAIKLLHAGMNCLVGVAEQQSQHALAVNYVQCLSLYRGLNEALMMAHQLWKRHPGCLELVLLVARLEGNKDGVAVFEQAVRCWPQPRVGLQRLWNQYALHVLQWEGKSSALHVLYRCASRASALDSSALRELREDSKVRDSLESIAENDNNDGNFGSIGEDAVFAWLNLALFEVLSGERGHAQAAVERSLKAAVSREDVRHCWREMAALTLLSDVGDLRQPSHFLDLLDRCCMETSMHWKLTPLSSRLSKNISKRHLRSFIDFLLGPSPVDYSVVNSFVQQYIAKGLKLGMHTSRLVEGVLAVMPGNVEVVLPLCRLVLEHNLSNTQEFAAAVWTISIVLSTLLQACPQAPEQDWVEVGKLLAHLGDKSSLQEFYQHALVVYPFSAVLRHSLLEVQQ